MTEEEKTEEIITKVEVMNKEKPDKDLTFWEEKDPWDFSTMTEKDIEEAEEARNA